jgi:hypothetical protein
VTTHVSTTARPRVVIIDVHASDSFREFAAALRRRGVDVVHLRPEYTGRGRRLKRSIDGLAGPTVPLTTSITAESPEAVALRRQVLSAPTVDVHATEPVIAGLCTTEEWQANPALHPLHGHISLTDVLDKWTVARLAVTADVAVPATSLELTTDRYPVVVKGRLGAGGMFVRIVDDEDALSAAVADFRADGVEPYLERYHPHVNGLGTAGVSRDGTVLVCGAFERLTSPDQPLQPAVAIRAYDDQAAIAASERLVEALGYTGIFCFNFVPDDDGSPLLIDVNLRVFGAWVTLDELGVPILDTYLELLGAGPPARPLLVDGDRWSGVARIGVGAHGSLGQVWKVTRDTGRLVWRRRSSLGPGWVAATELRVAQTGLSGAGGALRARRPH